MPSHTKKGSYVDSDVLPSMPSASLSLSSNRVAKVSEKVLPLIQRHSPIPNHCHHNSTQSNDCYRRNTKPRNSDDDTHHSFKICARDKFTANNTKSRPTKQHVIIQRLMFGTILVMNVAFMLFHHQYYDILWGSRKSSSRFVLRELSGTVQQSTVQIPVVTLHSIQGHSNFERPRDFERPIVQPRVDTGIKYYSSGRHDRTGAVLHDMLWVHAYAFSQNGTYGGACGGPDPTDPSKIKRTLYQNVTQELIDQLHWNRTLKYACAVNHTNSTTEINVDREFYTDLDVSIFTPQWKEYFQAEIELETKMVESAPDSNETPSYDPAKKQIGTMTGMTSIVEREREMLDNHANKAMDEINKDRVYTIAVHIRRGDVDPCTYLNRYMSNDYYLKLIKQYYKLVPVQYEKIVVDIYSQSESYESFDIFDKVYGYNLHLDDSLYNVWHALSTANVAILSKSSFSYVPAVINPNTVVYTTYRHLPLPSWHIVNRTLSDPEKRAVKLIHDTECTKNN